MARQKPNWQRAAEIVKDAGGRLVGRTKLQKVAYLLELAGLGTGFQFEYRHYGPYSEDLADAMQLAAAFDLVSEEERKTDWGGTYSIYTFSGTRTSQGGQRSTFAEVAAQVGAIELELAATAAYLKSVKGARDPWEDTKRLKPEKATASRLSAAKHAYKNLQRLPAPKKLPNL
jgi:uncharacterized protein YwgA